jgi:hypothetical protein
MLTATTTRQMYDETHGHLYAADMVKRVLLGVQEFRTAIAARVKAAIDTGEHTVLMRRGKPVGVYVPIEWYRDAARALKDPTEY